MFNTISDKYDLLNRLLSFGMDLSWRREMKKRLLPAQGQVMLDVATGTGDILIMLMNEPSSPISKGYGIDLAENMLLVARRKINEHGLAGKAFLEVGDGHHLSFPNNQFDLATISFGIRNMENPVVVLKEIYRVMKTGGRLLILEFSLPDNPLLRALHIFYLRTVVPSVGWFFSGNFAAYRYLNRTIESFPYGEQFCRILNQVGFERVEARPMCFGIATIYQGDKLNA